jgi:hypothetical protein
MPFGRAAGIPCARDVRFVEIDRHKAVFVDECDTLACCSVNRRLPSEATIGPAVPWNPS